ncbi:MAG: NUDIX domain-containing protein, partial [Bacteroidia bacterium]
IWEGLYEFPLIESKQILTEAKLLQSKEWKKWFGGQHPIIREASVTYTHLLSHQKIYARFYEVEAKRKPVSENWTETTFDDLQSYAIPRLIDRYMETR